MERTWKKAGDVLEWTSQSQGTVKKKRGVVVAVVPAGSDLHQALPEVNPSAFKAQAHAKSDRYLVRVLRDRGARCDYYAPLVKVVDGQARREGRFQ